MSFSSVTHSSTTGVGVGVGVDVGSGVGVGVDVGANVVVVVGSSVGVAGASMLQPAKSDANKHKAKTAAVIFMNLISSSPLIC